MDASGGPVDSAEVVIEALAAAVRARQPVALATVVETRAGAPAQPGFKLLVRPDGTALGNVGGGAFEARVRRDAVETLATGAARTAHYTRDRRGPTAPARSAAVRWRSSSSRTYPARCC